MNRFSQEWFTIEEIDHETIAISEYGHWEQTHAYLFIGKETAALIDTGTGIGNIKKEVEQLTDLPITVITTHCHWDHIGNHGHFDLIAIHADDQDWLEAGLPISSEFVKSELMKEPFSVDPPPDFSLDRYQVFTGKATNIFNDGDQIDLGNRKLEILHTPGHSPGHICVYEEDKGYLATGDILYEGTVYAHYPSTDPVALANSVHRLANLPGVKKILPGHNRINIPVEYLGKFDSLCNDIERNGALKHGTGLHNTEGISLLL